MNIFHEIYGVYFRLISEILKLPEITNEQKNKIISEYGFDETNLHINNFIKELINEENVPVIKNKPVFILTEIQKRWIKAKLYSPKINLFLENDIIDSLKKRLENVPPLYRNEDFQYTDRFNDGDDFSDINYQKNFRKIISAVKKHEVLEINFRNKNNKEMKISCVPLKIQYSPKNDRFRILAFDIQREQTNIINIGRITEINGTGEIFDEDTSGEKYSVRSRYVTVCISDERNAPRRFFMEFAPYKKRTEYDEKTGKCTVQLWYDKPDEKELLIRLLGFGAMIEIVSPPDLRWKAKEKIDRQYAFLNKDHRP